MLQMKKNTKAKIGTLAASGLALAAVLGLVRQNALPASQASSAASAAQAMSALVQPAAGASGASASGQGVKAAVTPVANTRTRVS